MIYTIACTHTHTRTQLQISLWLSRSLFPLIHTKEHSPTVSLLSDSPVRWCRCCCHEISRDSPRRCQKQCHHHTHTRTRNSRHPTRNVVIGQWPRVVVPIAHVRPARRRPGDRISYRRNRIGPLCVVPHLTAPSASPTICACVYRCARINDIVIVIAVEVVSCIHAHVQPCVRLYCVVSGSADRGRSLPLFIVGLYESSRAVLSGVCAPVAGRM